MADERQELIKALAIAIACLKSKTFDEGIIEDLEKDLKEAMNKGAKK